MATILSLGPSITDMTFDEAMDVIKGVRFARRQSKKKARKSKGSGGKKKATPKSLLSALSDQDKAELLAMLEEL